MIPGEDADFCYNHHKPPAGGTKCYFRIADSAFETKLAVNKQVPIGERIWDTYWIPVGDDIYLHYAIDITDCSNWNEE